jgi:hypothetical protein
MTATARIIPWFKREPEAPKPGAAITEELAQHLISARPRLDPSCPEECFQFLYDMHLYPYRVIEAHFDDALAELGQHYIAQEMARG